MLWGVDDILVETWTHHAKPPTPSHEEVFPFSLKYRQKLYEWALALPEEPALGPAITRDETPQPAWISVEELHGNFPRIDPLYALMSMQL